MSTARHIVFTTAWYPTATKTGGVFVKEQAEALARAGHQVTVLLFNYVSPRARLQAVFGRRNVPDAPDGFRLLEVTATSWLPLRLFRNPQQRQQQVIENALRLAMQHYIRAHGKPDVLHHHSLRANGWAAEFLAKVFQLPFVLTEHTPFQEPRDLISYDPFQTPEASHRFVQQAEARIAVSKTAAQQLEHLFGLPFEVIGNMVSRRFEAPLAATAPLPFRWVCMAVLNANKRHALLFEAFAQAFAGQPDVQLHLAGNGPLREALEAQARQLGIAQQVVFHGMLSREHILALLDQAHAAVLASARETYGIALAEALCRGLPVVSTRSGGPEMFVEPGINGELSATDSSTDLAAALHTVYSTHSRYQRASMRTDMLGQCSEAAIVQQLEQVYARVCDNSR